MTTKQIDRFRAMRREMEKTAELSADKHEEWKRRAGGPFWPILRRYVWLLDVCRQQAEYIEELNGILEEECNPQHYNYNWDSRVGRE